MSWILFFYLFGWWVGGGSTGSSECWESDCDRAFGGMSSDWVSAPFEDDGSIGGSLSGSTIPC